MRIEVDHGHLNDAIRRFGKVSNEIQQEERRRFAGITRSGRRRLKAKRALRRLTKPRRARPW